MTHLDQSVISAIYAVYDTLIPMGHIDTFEFKGFKSVRLALSVPR